MFEVSSINLVAVLIAWILSVGLGAFWYSPVGFGPLWSKLSGVDMAKLPQDEANRAISSVIVSNLVQVTALALIIGAIGASTPAQGALVGFVIWLGFIAATTLGNTLYSRLSWKFWWLNASFFLATMVVNGALFAIWK